MLIKVTWSGLVLGIVVWAAILTVLYRYPQYKPQATIVGLVLIVVAGAGALIEALRRRRCGKN